LLDFFLDFKALLEFFFVIDQSSLQISNGRSLSHKKNQQQQTNKTTTTKKNKQQQQQTNKQQQTNNNNKQINIAW